MELIIFLNKNKDKNAIRFFDDMFNKDYQF